MFKNRHFSKLNSFNFFLTKPNNFIFENQISDLSAKLENFRVFRFYATTQSMSSKIYNNKLN